MKHEIWWDQENYCGRIRLVGDLAADEATQLAQAMAPLVEGKSPRQLLLDHSASPNAVPRDTREAVQLGIKGLYFDKMAVFGLSNFNRVAGKIVVALSGSQDNSRFFKTEAEAIAWLRESR